MCAGARLCDKLWHACRQRGEVSAGVWQCVDPCVAGGHRGDVRVASEHQHDSCAADGQCDRGVLQAGSGKGSAGEWGDLCAARLQWGELSAADVQCWQLWGEGACCIMLMVCCQNRMTTSPHSPTHRLHSPAQVHTAHTQPTRYTRTLPRNHSWPCAHVLSAPTLPAGPMRIACALPGIWARLQPTFSPNSTLCPHAPAICPMNGPRACHCECNPWCPFLPGGGDCHELRGSSMGGGVRGGAAPPAPRGVSLTGGPGGA